MRRELWYAALMIFVCTSEVRAECASLWATGLKDGHADRAKRQSFRKNDRFVLCVSLSRSAFVSIWDAPPNGNPSRLYPNAVSHQNAAQVRGERLAAGKHCFGTSATFPLFFPSEQGLGMGRLSAVVTETVDGQPGAADWAIPGKVVQRERMAEITRHYGLGHTCDQKMTVYFEYSITQ